MKKKVNIGIIGCGHWGPNFVRNFSNIERSYVKYACDLNQQRIAHIKQLYPDIIITQDYRQILRDRDVNAVVIATPMITHFALAKEFISNHKHVLVEKPIATSINEAKELIAVAKDRKRVLMVGHTFKFNPAINKLRSIIQQKELGNIHYVYSRRTNLGPLRKDANAIFDLAPHDISILNYILNERPLSVNAFGEKYLPHDLEDVAFIMFRFPKKVIAHVQVSWLDPKKTREIIVVGSKKMLIFDDLNTDTPIVIYDKGAMKKKFKQDYDSFEEFQMITRDGKATIPRIKKGEPLKIECAHFIDCITKNKTLLSDGEDGLEVLKILLGIQSSLRVKGERIRFSWR